jgi:biopolymer transport protein ExbB/TolQ
MFNATETLNIAISSTSAYTREIMHVISQILLVPVIICLIIFFLYSILNCGILLAEYYKRRKANITSQKIRNILIDIKNSENSLKNIKNIIRGSNLSVSHKNALIDVAENCNMDFDYRKSIAREIVENEELILFKKLEKTDIIAKIAPALGLMGTLIPLGPGLVALGMGDTQTLADSLIIAFDTTVLAMGTASLAFIVSKVKKRWYMKDIDNLDSIAEFIIENFNTK